MKIVWVGMGICVLVLTGCAATQQVAIQEQPGICQFLGETCQHLTAGGEGQAGLRWINPQAKLTQYNKVMIDLVGFFGAEKEKVSPEDQQALTDVAYKALIEELGKKFQVVAQPGPGTMRIQVVLLDAEAATPGMRSLSMAIPQARVLSTAAYAATGKYPFVGGVQGAVKFTDSVTGQVLGAAVDRRVGGGSLATAAQWKWGDAETVIKTWAQMMAEKLFEYTSGKAKP